MAKAKSLDTWGRGKARKRYAEGGDVTAEDFRPETDYPQSFTKGTPPIMISTTDKPKEITTTDKPREVGAPERRRGGRVK